MGSQAIMTEARFNSQISGDVLEAIVSGKRESGIWGGILRFVLIPFIGFFERLREFPFLPSKS